MIVTGKQRVQLYKLVDDDARASRWMTGPQRRRLADLVEIELEQQIDSLGREFTDDDYEHFRGDMIAKLKGTDEVKGFKPKGFIGIGFIFTVVIGWIIGKVLDYLYDRWKEQRTA